MLPLIFLLSICSMASAKSPKRGIAYNLVKPADFRALSPGVSWFYNWAPTPQNAGNTHGIDFVPMLWSDDFNDAEVVNWLHANRNVKYLLLLNEPNLGKQANKYPDQAARFWNRYERIAERTGVKLVGPQITWGNLDRRYNDPVDWLDAFMGAFRDFNGGRNPRIDYLGFHWYDYGLEEQLNRLTKYGKPFWVTEFANWHAKGEASDINSVEKQKAQMREMVSVCERRGDVFRYAWFTGRRKNDVHHTSLLADGDGQLTALGRYYISL